MMTKSSSGGFTIAGSAQKLDVNNRIALRYYYRIADNILKQVPTLLIWTSAYIYDCV